MIFSMSFETPRMKAPDILSIIIASLYLLTYTLLTDNAETRYIAYLMFMFSPVIVITMVYLVLKKGKYTGKELGEEESGYADRM